MGRDFLTILFAIGILISGCLYKKIKNNQNYFISGKKFNKFYFKFLAIIGLIYPITSIFWFIITIQYMFSNYFKNLSNWNIFNATKSLSDLSLGN